MAPIVGDLVAYQHPSWGAARGRVLRTDGNPGHVLVQDLAPNGGREWWPVALLVRVVGTTFTGAANSGGHGPGSC